MKKLIVVGALSVWAIPAIYPQGKLSAGLRMEYKSGYDFNVDNGEESPRQYDRNFAVRPEIFYQFNDHYALVGGLGVGQRRSHYEDNGFSWDDRVNYYQPSLGIRRFCDPCDPLTGFMGVGFDYKTGNTIRETTIPGNTTRIRGMVTGYSVFAEGGVRYQISEKVSLVGAAPLISYRNRKTTPDESDKNEYNYDRGFGFLSGGMNVGIYFNF